MYNNLSIKTILSNHLNIKSKDINLKDKLNEFKLWDSLTALRIMSDLEISLGKKIELQSFFSAKNVDDLTKLLS